MSADIKVVGNGTWLENIFNRTYSKQGRHFVEVGPNRVILPGKFEQYYQSIANFEVRNDDVFLCAFPKTGSRWAQEMIWLILNDLNFEKAREIILNTRSPLLELETIFDTILSEHSIQELEKYTSPRCIRTHLQWSLLPKAISTGTKNPKIIVVLRGPEDTCTSYYHQAKVVEGFDGSWDDFCNLFLGGKVLFGPYWKHVFSFWNQRCRPNIMFIKYNRMKADLGKTVREVATFLEKTLTISDVEELCNHLEFESLKTSKGFNLEETFTGDVNPFIRTGETGGFKKSMSVEVIEAFDKQRKEYLVDSELTFD